MGVLFLNSVLYLTALYRKTKTGKGFSFDCELLLLISSRGGGSLNRASDAKESSLTRPGCGLPLRLME